MPEPTSHSSFRHPSGLLSLGVLVTNYNSWELTRRCLDAVLAHSAEIDRIVVVDDASDQPPGDPPAGIDLLRGTENLGFGGALNRGVRHLDTDLVAIFDSDAMPLTDFAPPARAAFLADPRLALAGFRTVDASGRTTPHTLPEPGLPSLLLGQRAHRWYAGISQTQARAATCVIAAAMVIRKTAFDQLHGFDERFRFLDLDVDYCLRVHRSEWTLTTLPEVVVFHEGGGTPQRTSDRVVRFYAARWELLRKHGKIRSPRLVKLMVLTRLYLELALLRSVGRILLRSKEELQDKLEGRKRSVRYCRSEYR